MDETVKQILEIVETINKRKISSWTGEELSAVAVKLAILKVYLGTFVADLSAEFNQAETARKMAEITAYREERSKDLSQKDAELNAKMETLELTEKQLESEANLEKIKTLHRDTRELISTIQSRLKFLISERGDTSLET